MSAAGVDALLVPRGDEFQGEYVPPSAERLKWLTGFTGSAGLAVIARKKAALFVDGRYTTQSRLQVDTTTLDIVQVPETKPSDWIAETLPQGGILGFDPWLHPISAIEALQEELKPRAIVLRPVARNLVDLIWGSERPAPPVGTVSVQPIDYAGRGVSDKIAELQKRLKRDGHAANLITRTDAIAWLFNIRGSDVAHTPVPLAFALVPAEGKPTLFISQQKLPAEVAQHLGKVAHITPPSKLGTALSQLRKASAKVRVDPAWTAYWFLGRIGRRNLVREADAITADKARKNAAELAGARAAHVRDGAAMVRFLAWFDHEAPTGRLDEITCVEKLEECRRDTGCLEEISFDTISGSGPNGAIVHYRVTRDSNRRIRSGELFLLDSGGQYRDGTTDITRTMAVGKPTLDMRRMFTLVLKGHIAIATARFPKGTRGVQLDTLARHALWQSGFDFDHGTGHGVGSFLSVHEGPQSISKAGMAVLEPGMIVSNEPGYYREGAFGIRIENLVVVNPPEKPNGGEREMLSFETITLCPIDRRLIDARLLTASEIEWLDGYHARVRKALLKEVKGDDRAWLEAATAPLAS